MLREIEASTIDSAPLYRALEDGSLMPVTVSLAGVEVVQIMRIARIRERNGMVWRDGSRLPTRVAVLAVLLERE